MTERAQYEIKLAGDILCTLLTTTPEAQKLEEQERLADVASILAKRIMTDGFTFTENIVRNLDK